MPLEIEPVEECQFCRDVKMLGERENVRVFVCWRQLSFRPDDKKHPRNNHGSITGRSCRMKFCPVCGRKFDKSFNV